MTRPSDTDVGLALVTGVTRRVGIGWAVASRLVADGFGVAVSGWRDYDERMSWGADPSAPDLAVPFYEVDLEDPDAASALVPTVTRELGPLRTLVLCHTESVDSDIRSTTVDSFDRHMAVNARATWLLIQSFAGQFGGAGRSGRIVSITSDATVGNIPYGASKGAMDRIVIAAASELADLGVTANVINPGGTDTGWMSPDTEQRVLEANLQPRVGRPADVANLVSFLCSAEGQWINGQLLHSNGGLV
ncbi:MAG: SDR family oxidoreductase [Actinomycetia bacterium]|nr:SDR family oxidoreductase [Actinomycetes bacterium]